MTISTRPGVRLEPAIAPPRVELLRTDVAGFVGVAAWGPLHEARRIRGPEQFQSEFGPPISAGFLPHAVHGFFAQGGRECWVVRVAHEPEAVRAEWRIADANGGPFIRLEARHPGSWANRLSIRIQRAASHRFHLVVRSRDGHEEIWPDLETEPDDTRDFREVLAPSDPTKGSALVRVTDVYPGLSREVSEEVILVRAGRDGLAGLGRTDFVSVERGARRGLGLLEEIDEVAIVAMPDVYWRPEPVIEVPRPAPSCSDLRADPDAEAELTQPATESRRALAEGDAQWLQHELLGHCAKLQDRFAVLDTPPEMRMPVEVIAERKHFDSRHGAIYFPWLRVQNPRREPGELRTVPPSGHVAGVYARVSIDPGVHKPPANELLADVAALETDVSNLEHGLLNDASVNVVRSEPGRGIRVAGARTLASDGAWRFVNVRRLVTMIEEALDQQLQWTVFEPNSQPLWRDIDRVVRGLLEGLWRRGMLDGSSMDEAFSVQCDKETNPSSEVEAGRTRCEITLLPPPPAEFVIVRIEVGDGRVRVTEAP